MCLCLPVSPCLCLCIPIFPLPSHLFFAFQPISMPHCPHCSKKGKTDMHLLQHMSHPASECTQFFDKLVWISEVLWCNKLRTHQQLWSRSTGFEDDRDMVMGGSDLPVFPEGSQSGVNNVQSNSGEEAAPYPKYYTEVYPGAAQTYGKWPTFMDAFDGDRHAMIWCERTIYIILEHLNLSGSLCHFCCAHPSV